MISTDDRFHQAAFGQIISPLVKLYMAFDKQIDMGSFFVLDKSELDGPDLVKAAAIDTPAQNWDFYKYSDFTDRLVSVGWERRLEFPYQVQCGMMDFTLSNTDGYFIPLSPKSSIGELNLPARPFRAYAGFCNGVDMIPQMVGLTQGLPDLNTNSHTVDYHGVDFLYDICNQPLTSVIDMRDVTADQVIAAILEDYGLAPGQYSLAKGRYNIPFVFFDIGESAGTALKQLVQSENGFLWLDEKGIVRFETSGSINSDTDIVAKFSDYHIMSITPARFDNIVNRVRITAEVREVQEWQEVYAKSESVETVSTSLWVVPANSSIEVKCNLSDPCYDVRAPQLGRASDVSWFTAIDQSLAEVSSGITATGVLSSNTFTITFTNNHAYPVEINEMKLWGEPAKVYDVLDYDAYDDESVEKYGEQLLEITDNQFFQTYQQADQYARSVISQRKDYDRTVEMQVKGDFALQLMDLIEIETEGGDYDGIYRVEGIEYSWDGSNLITNLTLTGGKEIKVGEFTLNISKLNGEDLIQ